MFFWGGQGFEVLKGLVCCHEVQDLGPGPKSLI